MHAEGETLPENPAYPGMGAEWPGGGRQGWKGKPVVTPSPAGSCTASQLFQA